MRGYEPVRLGGAHRRDAGDTREARLQTITIAGEVRRTTRNLFALSTATLIALLGVLVLFQRDFYNALFGPFAMDPKELAALKGAGEGLKELVTVTGTKPAVGTGMEQIERRVDKYTRKVKSERVVGRYVVLFTGQRLLLVKAGTGEPAARYTGVLVPIPRDLKSRLVDNFESRRAGMRGVFLPFMLDAQQPFRAQALGGLGLVLGLMVLAGWGLRTAVRRSGDPGTHPIMKSLAEHGAVETVAAAIDAELAEPQVLTIDRITLTRGWLVRRSPFGLVLLPFKDLIWAYKKVTQHSVNFIPTGKTYSLVACTRNLKARALQVRSAPAVDRLLEGMRARAPWAIYGYSDELVKLWRSNAGEMVRAVDMRRLGA